MKNMLRNINGKKILDLWPKISNGARNHQSDIILVIGVILISLLSFAMGYIVAKTYEQPLLQFEESGYYRGWNNRSVFRLEVV